MWNLTNQGMVSCFLAFRHRRTGAKTNPSMSQRLFASLYGLSDMRNVICALKDKFTGQTVASTTILTVKPTTVQKIYAGES